MIIEAHVSELFSLGSLHAPVESDLLLLVVVVALGLVDRLLDVLSHSFYFLAYLLVFEELMLLVHPNVVHP